MNEKWYQTWRPAMAYLYMILCIGDYIIRPAVNYKSNRDFDFTKAVESVKGLDSGVQVGAIGLLKDKGFISPILNEFVHLAFGAVLGISAFGRNQERQIMLRKLDVERSKALVGNSRDDI